MNFHCVNASGIVKVMRTTPLLAWFGRNDEPTSQHTPPTGFTEVQERDCSTVAYRQAPGPGTHSASGATYT